MSLINLLEGCKDVAIAKREEAAAQSAEDVAEFEEFGADLVRARAARLGAHSHHITNIDASVRFVAGRRL